MEWLRTRSQPLHRPGNIQHIVEEGLFQYGAGREVVVFTACELLTFEIGD